MKSFFDTNKTTIGDKHSNLTSEGEKNTDDYHLRSSRSDEPYKKSTKEASSRKFDTQELSTATPENNVKAIYELFENYKSCFRASNFNGIEKVIASIASIAPESPILDLINGEISLFKGHPDKSYLHISRYLSKIRCTELSDENPNMRYGVEGINNNKSNGISFFNSVVHSYALKVIAMWNDAMGFYKVGYTQHVRRLKYPIDKEAKVWTLFHAITNKKRMSFLDSARAYYERIMALPDGYKLLRCIKLQMIHLHVLKKDYSSAADIIKNYVRFRSCIYIRRMVAYINYNEKNYVDIMKSSPECAADPYISYIIARTCLDNMSGGSISGVDVSYYFDEAIKKGGPNAFFHNTYGNYFYKIRRYADAAEQYKNALSVNPNFVPAIENMKKISKFYHSSTDNTYVANSINSETTNLSDSDPDVEEMGFFDILSMIGYTVIRNNRKRYGNLSPIVL